jgi:hypothetical protein
MTNPARICFAKSKLNSAAGEIQVTCIHRKNGYTDAVFKETSDENIEVWRRHYLWRIFGADSPRKQQPSRLLLRYTYCGVAKSERKHEQLHSRDVDARNTRSLEIVKRDADFSKCSVKIRRTSNQSEPDQKRNNHDIGPKQRLIT